MPHGARITELTNDIGAFMAVFRTLLKPSLLVTFAVLVSAGVVSGCATTTYGQDFVRDEQVAGQFRLKVYLSVFTGADAADKQAKAEIDKYVAANKMASGTIVNRRYNLLPEYYEYTVKFNPR